MTVLLVLAMFAIFLSIDYLLKKRPAVQPALEMRAQASTHPPLQPNVVSGFRIPENLRYHPGHTWTLAESPKSVRVGLDDFAARLIGKVEAISLPQRGQWLRQGQRLITIKRNGATTDMVSPIEGVVTDINEFAAKDPEIARQDPYGEGWLLTVEAPDAKLNFRNLLSGDLARWWLEEASTRLRRRMPMPAGAFAQDGGVAVYDLTSSLADEKWSALTREFFLA